MTADHIEAIYRRMLGDCRFADMVIIDNSENAFYSQICGRIEWRRYDMRYIDTYVRQSCALFEEDSIRMMTSELRTRLYRQGLKLWYLRNYEIIIHVDGAYCLCDLKRKRMRVVDSDTIYVVTPHRGYGRMIRCVTSNIGGIIISPNLIDRAKKHIECMIRPAPGVYMCGDVFDYSILDILHQIFSYDV